MPTPIQSLLRKATRRDGEELNILTFPSDAHYDISMCETGNSFWSLQIPGSKSWPSHYPIPNNYHIIYSKNGQANLPLHVDFDCIIAHDRLQQYELAKTLSNEYQIPLILVDHSLPPVEWNDNRLMPYRNRDGDVNVFIVNCQRSAWGFHPEYPCVVNSLGINTKLFYPDETVKREDFVLWIGDNVMYRDDTYGSHTMRYVTGFPMPMMSIKIIGNNPGVSKNPSNISDLVSMYRKASVLLNTCPNNPLPTTVLEAMACGCPVVSIDIGDISQVIKHGETGFISNDLDEIRNYCTKIVSDKILFERLSENCIDLTRKKFGMFRFTKLWLQIFSQLQGY